MKQITSITNRIEGPTLKKPNLFTKCNISKKTIPIFKTRPFNSLLVNLSPECRPTYKNSKSRQGLI